MLWHVLDFPSFLRLNDSPLHVCTTFCLSVDGHLGCSIFYLLCIILQKGVYNYLFETLFSVLPGEYLEVELLDPVALLCFILWGMCVYFVLGFCPDIATPSLASNILGGQYKACLIYIVSFSALRGSCQHHGTLLLVVFSFLICSELR